MSDQSPTAPPPRTDKNRRSSVRKKASGRATVTCHQGAFGMGPDLARSLLDVSESGARLRVKVSLAKDSEVLVGLLGPGQMRAVTLTGRVAWCVPSAEEDFVVGVEFEKYLRYADLMSIT